MPGCYVLVQYGMCPEHKAQSKRERNQRIDSNRPSAHARGYDRKWRDTRADFLWTHPLCTSESCLRIPHYLRPQATDVDHLDGLGPLGPAGHDPANLQALCHPCHSRKTALLDGGFGRRPTT